MLKPPPMWCLWEPKKVLTPYSKSYQKAGLNKDQVIGLIGYLWMNLSKKQTWVLYHFHVRFWGNGWGEKHPSLKVLTARLAGKWSFSGVVVLWSRCGSGMAGRPWELSPQECGRVCKMWKEEVCALISMAEVGLWGKKRMVKHWCLGNGSWIGWMSCHQLST